MGMDLIGPHHRHFSWNVGAWRCLLDLGESYGWSPIGTGAPRGTRRDAWNGTYFSNDGQLFYARDAKSLADALARFLGTEPRSFEKRKEQEELAWFLSAEGVKTLRSFIRFCRVGSFRIY
jgi:hypothetical protein